MDQATLVGPDILLTNDALDILDKAGLKPAVALLAISSEYEDWRLVVASPLLDQTHPLRAYEQVTAAWGGRFVGTLLPLLVLPMKDPFIRELRRLFAKAKDLNGMRLGGQRIGDRFILNAYVLRVT